MNFKQIKQPEHIHNRRTDHLILPMIHINQNYLVGQNVKTVIFKGINNKNLKRVIFQYLNIDYIFKRKKRLTFHKINFIVSRLRHSGFFNHISASYLPFNNRLYLLIQLNLNPILKEIMVQNVNELKIPKKYLISILQKQIGYPKSLKIINNMIHKIQSWYFIRGYKWIRIWYKVHHSNRSRIELTILESQISSIEVYCLNAISQSYKKFMESLILNQLKIMIGQNLNFYNIEFGIMKLKNQKLISNCNYEIKYTNTNTLKIIIKYRCFEDRMSYFFNRSIYFQYQLFDYIHRKTYLAFNKLLHGVYDFVYWQQIRNIYFHLQDQANSSIFSNLHYNNLFLSNFLQIRDIIKHKKKENTLIILKNSIKFRHRIHYFNNSLINLLISFEKYQRNTNIIISYKYPVPENNLYDTKYSLLSLFRNIFKIDDSMFKAIFEQTKHKKKFLTSIYISYGTDIMFMHDISPNISIFQKLSFFNTVYNKIFLYIKYLPENLYEFFQSTNNRLKNRICTVHQKFICYMIEIKLNRLTFKDRFIPSNSWNLSVKAHTPLMFNRQEVGIRKIVNHLVSIQYRRIINFSNNILDAFTNTFILNIDFKAFWGAVAYIPINMLNILNNWQILEGSSSNLITTMSTYIYTNIEYYIYKQYHIGLFLFLDGKQYFNVKHLNHEINKMQESFYFFGTGLEISLPISQIPIIKTKYEINIDGSCRLYTKLYFK